MVSLNHSINSGMNKLKVANLYLYLKSMMKYYEMLIKCVQMWQLQTFNVKPNYILNVRITGSGFFTVCPLDSLLSSNKPLVIISVYLFMTMVSLYLQQMIMIKMSPKTT